MIGWWTYSTSSRSSASRSSHPSAFFIFIVSLMFALTSCPQVYLTANGSPTFFYSINVCLDWWTWKLMHHNGYRISFQQYTLFFWLMYIRKHTALAFSAVYQEMPELFCFARLLIVKIESKLKTPAAWAWTTIVYCSTSSEIFFQVPGVWDK